MAERIVSANPKLGDAGPSGAPALLRVRLLYRVGGSQPLTDFGSGTLQADFYLTRRRNVLFGASGAGKSTLLRLLAGLLRPVEGTIALEDRLLTDTAAGIALPAGQRGIGYLTQEPALFPHLNVEANIAYGLHPLSRDTRSERVAAMLALFSLEPFARRLPEQLSGGERQRVALARALAPDPSLLLLDEAFAGLDVPLRQKMAAALDQYLQGRPTTVLAVSHDVAEVYSSDAEVLLLEGGRITEQGPAQQVLAEHRERLLRQLGAPSGKLAPFVAAE